MYHQREQQSKEGNDPEFMGMSINNKFMSRHEHVLTSFGAIGRTVANGGGQVMGLLRQMAIEGRMRNGCIGW